VSRRRWTALVLVITAAGCDPSVKDICDNLVDCGGGVGLDCTSDGEALERMAQAHCSEEFSTYLECLDEAECTWRTECEGARETVRVCVGELPE
jgi:hypothetical protein